MSAAALHFPMPTTLGSIDNYISAVNRFPLLTLEQEQDLGRRWKSSEDMDAARQLVLSHLRLVVSIARGYLGYGLAHNDLIQEGNIGLMKAVRRFDPERGVRLVSFAMHWIKAEIHEYILKNWRLVKVATTKAQRKLFFNLRSMRSQDTTLGLTEAKRIAKTLGVKPEEVMEMDSRLYGRDVSLELTVDDDNNDSAVAPISYLVDPAMAVADVYANQQSETLRHEGLVRAIAKLDDRSRDIIQARWLAEDAESTLQTLADKYGVSAERIRQIEVRAMKQMRAEIGD
jgi:RNA polymerase sigma-32 factor